MEDFRFSPFERAKIAIMIDEVIEMMNMTLTKLEAGKHSEMIDLINKDIVTYQAIRNKAIGQTPEVLE